jgi:hypothetical protein
MFTRKRHQPQRKKQKTGCWFPKTYKEVPKDKNKAGWWASMKKEFHEQVVLMQLEGR